MSPSHLQFGKVIFWRIFLKAIILSYILRYFYPFSILKMLFFIYGLALFLNIILLPILLLLLHVMSFSSTFIFLLLTWNNLILICFCACDLCLRVCARVCMCVFLSLVHIVLSCFRYWYFFIKHAIFHSLFFQIFYANLFLVVL